MKRLLTYSLLALTGVLFAISPAAAQTPLNYEPGDLLMGFRATDGTGAPKCYLVNLGQASTFTSATSPFTVMNLGNIKADLDGTFPGWQNEDSVFWSVSGAVGNFAAVGNDPARTVYATRVQTVPGTANPGSSRWTRGSSTTQGVVTSKMDTMADGYEFVNGDEIAGVKNNSTANSNKARLQNTTDVSSYASYQPGGTPFANNNGISFAQFNPSVEATFANGTANSILELYRVVPGAGAQIGTPSDFVGTFQIDNNANLTFTPTPSAEVAFTSATFEGSESGGTIAVNLTRGGVLSTSFAVTLNTADGAPPGGAVAGTDYTAQTNVSVPFAVNETSKTVNIPVTNRPGFQGNRTFTATLSLATNGTKILTPSTATVRILEADTSTSVQFESATYTVTETGPHAVVKLVRVGAEGAFTATVNTADIPGEAVAGTDYTAQVNTQVAFLATDTEKMLNIPVADRAGTQGNRDFEVEITSVTNGVTIGTLNTTTVTIEETTLAPVSFASATYIHSPKNSLGADVLTFDVTVERANGAGTASATVANDALFVAAAGHTKLLPTTHFTLTGAGPISFAEGETSKIVTVTIFTTTPTPGQFRLSLTGVTPAVGTNGSTVVTIRKKDTSKPGIAITSPTSSVPDPGTFNLTGTVKDDNALDLSLFEVKLNGAVIAVNRGAYVANTAVAFSANGLQAENGPNTITITARDAQGNVTVSSKTFNYINTTLGTATAGIYNGVLVPSGNATNDTSGFVTITVTSTAAFSGKVTLSGIQVGVSGVLANNGAARFKPLLGSSYDLVDKTEFESYLGSFNFAVSGGQATGNLLTASGGSLLASFTAKKNYYDGLTPATTVQASSNLLNLTTKGVYNIALPSEAQVPALATNLYPQGDGVGTVTLTPNGVVAVKGNLADGTAFSASGRLAEDLSVALYWNLYKKRGSLAGNISFDVLASDSDVSGANLLWIRPAQPRARYYPAGWESGIKVDLVGTQYNPVDIDFGQGADLLTTGNASLVFEDGLLTSPVTKGVNINSTTGKVTLIPSSATDYKVSLSATTGLFSGVFTHTDTKLAAYKGAILNKGANKGGFGYFLSTPPASYGGSGQGGGVSLQP